MPSLKALKINNLRSLVDTGYIPIKPVTILVGKNSAGKSTFARTLPLLKQSSEEHKRSPILWYGRLIDFGSFDTSLNRNSSDKGITFGFDVNIELNNFLCNHNLTKVAVERVQPDLSFSNQSNRTTTHKYDDGISIEDLIEYRFYETGKEKKPTQVKIELQIKKHNNSSYASMLTIEIEKNIWKVFFSNDNKVQKISVNDYEFKIEENISINLVTQGKLIPSYILRGLKSENPRINHLVFGLMATSDNNPFMLDIKNILTGLGVSSEYILRFLWILQSGGINIIESKINTPGSPLALDNETFEKIKALYYAARLTDIIEPIDNKISEYLNNVYYIEPLRATAQRYYRRQDLAVDHIDSKGTNIAMFLDNMQTREKTDLNSWMEEHFNIHLDTKTSEGHIALIVKKNPSHKKIINEPKNIADLGFGYSQLIPIIMQLWAATRDVKTKKSSTSKESCVIIEQPELHLHPAYQAKIADIIVKYIKSGENYTTIIETHSPHLISRLGELIEQNHINKDQVQVIMFEQDENNENESSVSISHFNDEGILINWPYGFFEP